MLHSYYSAAVTDEVKTCHGICILRILTWHKYSRHLACFAWTSCWVMSKGDLHRLQTRKEILKSKINLSTERRFSFLFTTLRLERYRIWWEETRFVNVFLNMFSFIIFTLWRWCWFIQMTHQNDASRIVPRGALC